MQLNLKKALAAAAIAGLLAVPAVCAEATDAAGDAAASEAASSEAAAGEETADSGSSWSIWSWLGFGSDSGEGTSASIKLFKKNGFEAEDGHLYHYTDGSLDTYEQGFTVIDDKVYHITEAGSVIDAYPAGFVSVEGVLCHVSADGGAFDVYPAGFNVIDGGLYHASQDGFALDVVAAGTCEYDGALYYSNGDGSFLVNAYVGHLYFGADGRYTSGNTVLDGYVDEAYNSFATEGMTKAQKLRAAYLYVREHGAYLARPHQARGSTDWAEESAVFMFEHKKGNCYCFAGQFLYLARRCGYDAYVVSGGVGHSNADHAWVMIHENGVPYIYDVELEWGYRVGKYNNHQKANYNMFKMPLNNTVFSYTFP